MPDVLFAKLIHSGLFAAADGVCDDDSSSSCDYHHMTFTACVFILIL
jgi:hypothetical protein